MTNASTKRALVSVSDKQGLDVFVKGLVELGFDILSTGGTRRYLEDAGVSVIDVSSYTQFPEIMGGRVKTLHPKVHGAILGRPDLSSDAEAIIEHEIVPFQLVVCNLYPFEKTITRPDVTVDEAIEQIDIGGPSMVRSAAKNHAYIAIVTSANQYDSVLNRLKSDSLDPAFRRQLAARAFQLTARYDTAIANYMAKITSDDQSESESPFAETLQLSLRRKSVLRYGENPHQQAAFFVQDSPVSTSLACAEQLNGKELSYNKSDGSGCGPVNCSGLRRSCSMCH